MVKAALRFFGSHDHQDGIVLPGSSGVLYVDPKENRGKILIWAGGVTQPRLAEFWNKAVQEFKPSLVLDIGVNYGECIFSTQYPEDCAIYGIEANRKLEPFVERSRKAHPNGERIKLVYALASDQDAARSSFYVSKYWSGASSAILSKKAKLKGFEKQDVTSIKVDTLLGQHLLEKERLLFKIDVEGYEPHVLRGMEQVCQRIREMLGFMEFDSHFLQKAGIPVIDYLSYLQQRFIVFVYVTDQKVIHFKRLTLESLQETFKRKAIHTDFILASSIESVRRLDLQIVEAE